MDSVQDIMRRMGMTEQDIAVVDQYISLEALTQIRQVIIGAPIHIQFILMLSVLASMKEDTESILAGLVKALKRSD